MKNVGLYANEAIHVVVNIPNLSQKEYEERIDEVFGELLEMGYDMEDITDTYLDIENNVAHLYFLNGNEIPILEFSTKNNEPKMNLGEYIIFSDLMAEKFNDKDICGNKDFKKGDEIKVGGISHVYGEPHIIKYRLETYIVRRDPIVIDLEDVSETEEESDERSLSNTVREDGTTMFTNAPSLSGLEREAEMR